MYAQLYCYIYVYAYLHSITSASVESVTVFGFGKPFPPLHTKVTTSMETFKVKYFMSIIQENKDKQKISNSY